MQKQCIAIVPLFNHLSPAEMTEILAATSSITFRKGETIYRAGELSDGLYIIHKGKIKIYRLSNMGKEQLVRMVGPGNFTGELSLFREMTHDAYAEAMEDVEICRMDRHKFQQFLIAYPAISLKMLSEFSLRLSQVENQATHIALETAETRIAMFLANEVENQKSIQISLGMSRKDLASFLGTTPETVSRKLTEFEAAGWIRQHKGQTIEIIDLDALLLL
ncbi:Crp/Fnr family transcriptional regulator [Paenibacillus yanchengensis]|uniref:Crp/Fnr family transcriptional regulator n=1 Tax=Paenibacillus yanchengensis TaxID=2035833 RepID=A0ABW4YEZ8_9BACL